MICMEQLLASCPHCKGRNLFYEKYVVALAVLKERAWLLCKDCDYYIEVEKFKKMLYSV